MVGRKKKLKTCDKMSHEEDRISKLPDSLISEILSHLSTKDVVRTGALSTRWRNLWQWVPALDLAHSSFPNLDAFVSFAERFIDSHKESWIRKLRLCTPYNSHHEKSLLTRVIDAVTTRRIQHLYVDSYNGTDEIPLSIFTCETLVHLHLCDASLPNPEFVFLPCLKIMHLRHVRYTNKATLQKLISGSPVLEDLTIVGYSSHNANFLQVRSQTLKRIYLYLLTKVEIDAPLLQYLSTTVSPTKNFKIINPGFFAKLDIDADFFFYADYSTKKFSSSVIHDILTNISRVRDLVISNHFWKDIFLYTKSGPVLQFGDLSRLDASISKSNLEMLPTILESCPKLESFILTLVKDSSMPHKKKKEPKVMFSTVPRCLVSSLKFVELKRQMTTGYEREKELVRYLLKNATMLQRLKLDIYYPENAKCGFLQELLTMPRCSSACEIHCSFIAKRFFFIRKE